MDTEIRLCDPPAWDVVTGCFESPDQHTAAKIWENLENGGENSVKLLVGEGRHWAWIGTVHTCNGAISLHSAAEYRVTRLNKPMGQCTTANRACRAVENSGKVGRSP